MLPIENVPLEADFEIRETKIPWVVRRREFLLVLPSQIQIFEHVGDNDLRFTPQKGASLCAVYRVSRINAGIIALRARSSMKRPFSGCFRKNAYRYINAFR